MNVKRKNGKAVNKTGFSWNTLFGKIKNVHSAFSINSNGSDNVAHYLFDENTRKSVEVVRFEAERSRVEASKLRLKIS